VLALDSMYDRRMEKTKSVTINRVPISLIKKVKREASDNKMQVSGVWIALAVAGLASREPKEEKR